MKRKKISLKRRSLESLSNSLMTKIEGGDIKATTSFGSCTGSLCCSHQDPPTITTGANPPNCGDL